LLLNFLLEINSWAFSTEPASHTAASINPLKNNPAGTVKLSIDNNYTKQESAHSIVPVSYFDFLIIPVIKPLASEDFKLSIEIFEDGADGQFREQRVYDIQLIKKQSRRGFRL
jgi:hypothetical protein